MRRDRKRAAETEQIDVARFRKERGRGFQVARVHRLAERVQRRLRFGDEAPEHRRRACGRASEFSSLFMRASRAL